METKELLKRSASMLRNWKLLHIQEPWFKKSSADSVVADFFKNDTVQTKIGTIHLKFDKKNWIQSDPIFYNPSNTGCNWVGDGSKQARKTSLVPPQLTHHQHSCHLVMCSF
jgi:hypothetical protein